MITLALAQRIADSAFEEAAREGLTRLAVVVTDAGGNIRAAARSDGQAPFAIDIAHAKARSALGFRMSTLRLASHFGENPSSTIGINGATGGAFLPIGGGVVAIDDEGRVLGAAAIAGGLPARDDAIVRAALQQQRLQALA